MAAANKPTHNKTDVDEKRVLTVEQRTHRIAEDYRLLQKVEEWWLEIRGKDPLSLERSKTLNGMIKYIKNRIEYLAAMNPPIQRPSAKAEEVTLTANPAKEEMRPGETETKQGNRNGNQK